MIEPSTNPPIRIKPGQVIARLGANRKALAAVVVVNASGFVVVDVFYLNVYQWLETNRNYGYNTLSANQKRVLIWVKRRNARVITMQFLQ